MSIDSLNLTLKSSLLEPNQVKKLCISLGIQPKKSLSQNFLCSNVIASKIVSLAQARDHADVIEIGPGAGALTYYLSQSNQLTVVEKDDFWSNFIKENYPQVDVVHGDVLNVNSQLYANKTVVGNLPYNKSTVIIRTLLSSPTPPARMIVMLQKEVAMRLVGSKASKLSLGVAYYGQAKLRFLVQKNYFYPKPKVDSAIVEITTHHHYSRGDQEKDFFRLIKLAFGAPRKKISNNLKPLISSDLWPQISLDLGIAGDMRPENINIDQWLSLLAWLKR